MTGLTLIKAKNCVTTFCHDTVVYVNLNDYFSTKVLKECGCKFKDKNFFPILIHVLCISSVKFPAVIMYPLSERNTTTGVFECSRPLYPIIFVPEATK